MKWEAILKARWVEGYGNIVSLVAANLNGRKEEIILINDALNTLYGVGHLVKDH